MARPIKTYDWWPATLALMLLAVPNYVMAEPSDPGSWLALISFGCTIVGACLLGVGGYRIFKWAGSE